ncbi:probable RNA-directed DNA polymerase from transposon BS [Hydra vulgaris]|uniref:probable RNA-directed DNA polymerase from transposon BS n=1 Tax=Hydra vulgaris TaxID=6087 RepID=UPI0032EA5FB8
MNLMFYKVNWVEIFDKMNTNQCYEYFLKIYEKACKQYIPRHFKPTSSIKNPCINKKIKNLVRKKRSLWCRVRATNFKNTNLNNEYKLINKTIKKQIKKSTFDYEINLAKDVKHNPKRFYAYAQRKNQTHTKLLALKTSDNKIITDKKVIANLLNCSFQSVFVKKNQDLPYFSNKTSHLFECDWDQELKEEIIFNYLLELNENKSLGCDNISPYVLKHCVEGLSKPLSLIFKKSIHSGELPELWKSANITPLFKKGDKKDPLNYRPISLTSIPSKIIEKIIRKKLIIYITENNLLTSQQHGFIQNKGCLTNLLETFDIITTEIENGYPVDILFLDFAKAFDKVPHYRLIHKISNYGIKGNILNWIDSFLKNRKQRVVMGEVVSDWCEVYSGVPQGSVLGPLLFLLYINDLPQCISSIAKLYADDTKIISVIKEHNDLTNMQNDIDLLTEWSNVWLMDFNINKCSVIHIGRKNINYNYTIKHDNQSFVLKTTTKELDLGVIVSSNMKWNHQVQAATSKAQRILCLIRKSFTYLNTEMVRQLYTSLVRPHLEFAAPVWSPSNKNNINDLEKI